MVHWRKRGPDPDAYIFSKFPQLNDVEYLQELFQPGLNLAQAAEIVGCSQPQLSVVLKHHGFVRQWVFCKDDSCA